MTAAMRGISEHALTLRVSGWEVPAALTLPDDANGALASAILLVPGSLFCDVNGDFPAWNSFPHVYGHLARQLSARGHAVYRFAKMGPGTGSVAVDETRAAQVRSWDGRVTVAVAALAAMRAALVDMRVRAKRMILAGHSEGAVVALRMLAERGDQAADVEGLVLLSGPAIGILGIMREQLHMFVGAEDLAAARENLDRAVALIRRGEAIPEELGRMTGVQGLFSTGPVGWKYLAESDASDPAAMAARVGLRTLIVQGGRDTSVRPHHADTLERARDGLPTELLLLPELSHMYKDVPADVSLQEAFGWPGETDARVADGVSRWIGV